MPAMSSTWSAVSGGTDWSGAGIFVELTMASACSPSSRYRPAPPTTITPPSVPALAIRKRRRVHSGECQSISVPSPMVPAAAPATESRPNRAMRPAATAIAALTTASAGDASGSRSAAAAARTPNATKNAAPSQRRRAPRMPAAPARTSATTTTATLSASLLFVPNRLTITSLAPGGCRLITSDPIEITSEGAPATVAATISAAAIATPAASAPETAGRQVPASRRRGPVRLRAGPGPPRESCMLVIVSPFDRPLRSD